MESVQIAYTIAALEDFKQHDIKIIEDKECGLCYNMYRWTGRDLVGKIANKCAPYKEDSDEPAGIVIYDPYNKVLPTASSQYTYAKLYEGTQLELRKEFAQLCIDYLKETIRI